PAQDPGRGRSDQPAADGGQPSPRRARRDVQLGGAQAHEARRAAPRAPSAGRRGRRSLGQGLSHAIEALTVKAVLLDRYGPPTNLRLGEAAPPVPADEEVLVRVRASSVNAVDWHVIRADPFIVRLRGGF